MLRILAYVLLSLETVTLSFGTILKDNYTNPIRGIFL